MFASVLWILAAAIPIDPAPSEAHYLDASLDLDGRLLSWRVLDLDRNGGNVLVLAVGTKDGERELRLHPFEPDGLARTPRATIPVLADVVAWGAADVREEAGREFVLLTRAGAWSYSPTLSGYRDNAQRLANLELIYDLPDPRALPHWRYVFEGGEREALVLPGRDQASVWWPKGDGYERRATLATEVLEATLDGLGGSGRSSGSGPRVAVDADSPFLADGRDGALDLLADAHSYRAPALVDVDGDGHLDLVVRGDERLAVHLGGPDGPAEQPTRVEAFPEQLVQDEEEGDEREVRLRLVHLDGDDLLDLLVVLSDEGDGFENRLHRVLVYRATADALFAEQPAQVLRFEAAGLDLGVVDVDGDGWRDLTVEKLELPSLVGAVTGLEFTRTLQLFPGGERGFERRPALVHEETFDEDTAQDLVSTREWKLDCDGDGVADLVEVDADGDLAIRRVRRERGRLKGASWSVERAPWKEFAVEGTIGSLTVQDVNRDGLGDVISATEDRFTVLLSVRAGGGR